MNINKNRARKATSSKSKTPRSASHHPFKLKKILVPIDFSDCSKTALQYAVPFARQFGAELIALHVIERYPAVSDTPTVDFHLFETTAAKAMERELVKLTEELGLDLVSRSISRIGVPHFTITSVAREVGADLIVLSTHGRTGLGHLFLGSTAEQVVRYAKCPVLVVRENEHEFIPLKAKAKL
jgi:universal stress protein A